MIGTERLCFRCLVPMTLDSLLFLYEEAPVFGFETMSIDAIRYRIL